MIRLLLAYFRPVNKIATELRVLRELYELDLNSRVPPIYRFTEKPEKSDTTVTYMGQHDQTPRYKRWFENEMEPEDYDE